MSLFSRNAILLSPKAVRHAPGQAGYIPLAPTSLDLMIDSEYAFVYSCNRHHISYLKGADQVIYPASTTKLLTILCALEVLSPEEIVIPGEELFFVEEDSSLADIRQGCPLTVERLIEGMLLPSGNDAAYALAAAAGRRISHDKIAAREAVDTFMHRMNEHATALGLTGSHFTTPDGLAGENHYTTLEDMILVAKSAMKNRIIKQYAARQRDIVTDTDGYMTTWINTNALLHPGSPYYRASVTGLKTGSLDNNYCVIVTVEQNGQRDIVGIFGAKDSDSRFADAATIIDVLLGAEEAAS